MLYARNQQDFRLRAYFPHPQPLSPRRGESAEAKVLINIVLVVVTNIITVIFTVVCE